MTSETLIKTREVRIIGTLKVENHGLAGILSDDLVDEEGHGSLVLTKLTHPREEEGDPLMAFHK